MSCLKLSWLLETDTASLLSGLGWGDSLRGSSSARGSGFRRARRGAISSRLRLANVQDLLQSGCLDSISSVLLLLKLGQTASLVVDIDDLLLALSVEVNQLLASWGGGGLLEVRVEAGEQASSARGDAVALVSSLGTVGGVVLLIQAGQGGHEASRHSVLVVKLDSTLQGSISDHVAVSEVLGQNACTRLLLLCDLIRVAFCVCCGLWLDVILACA